MICVFTYSAHGGTDEVVLLIHKSASSAMIENIYIAS